MADEKTAMLQIEIDRGRAKGMPQQTLHYNDYGVPTLVYSIARAAMADTINNGGTFVLVATADKLTIVQRAEAESLEPDEPTTGDGGRG